MKIARYAGTMAVAAALLVGACSSGGIAGDGAGGRGGGGSSGGGASGRGGAGAAGGGTCTPSCGPTEFCDLSINTCAGGSGHCVTRPVDCIEPEKTKVCACDGKVYASECEANGSGQDLSDVGGCTPPAGMFACGSIFCTHGTEYCWQVLTTDSPIPGFFNCYPLPSTCGTTPTCACVTGCPRCTISLLGDLTSTCERL